MPGVSCTIAVRQAVTALNDGLAETLRAQFKQYGIWVLNLIAAPGAGKTALIEKTIGALAPALRITVIEGDPWTRLDSERINSAGARGIQINTHDGCHLDARMIDQALDTGVLANTDILVIENVGNLLCPAAWDLGQDVTAVVSSLTEGTDKPLKYPNTFLNASVLVINKTDLAPYLPVSPAILASNALSINPDLTIFWASCLTGAGLGDWYDWVKTQTERKKGGSDHA